MQNQTTKRIGIIGGAGVAATNLLLSLIEEQVTRDGAKRDCDHPELIVWHATKAPSRSMFLEGKGPSFIDDYVQIASHLKNCGADILCMNCNTAHYAIDEIAARAEVKILNLVQKVAQKALSTRASKIGLMVTDGCRIGKVYERYTPPGYIVYPDPQFQNLVTRGICHIKNSTRFISETDENHPSHIFRKVKNHLIEKGADLVVAGCTDIRVGYHDPQNIDSLEVMKDMLLEVWHHALD